MEKNTSNTLATRLEDIARYILFGVVLILPFAILPASWLPLPMLKMGILAVGALGALVLWSVARLNEHSVEIPKTHMMWATLLLVVGYIVSAVLSDGVMRSFIGFGFERDTVLAMATFVGAFSAVAVTTRSVVHVMQLQTAAITGFGVIFIFHVLRLLIGAENMLPSLFSRETTATLLGSWNDLAVYSGLILLMSLAGLALFPARKVLRNILYGVLATAMFLLILVNLGTVWVTLMVGVFLLGLYIFADASYTKESGTFKPTVPWKRLMPSIGVIVVSLVFLIGGGWLGNIVADTLGIAHLDVRPSWEGTIGVASNVYADSPFVGVGPNSFREAWAQYRPVAVNETNFRNTDFNFGVGVIPTAFITGGLVVGLLWIGFFVAFGYLGFRIFAQRLTQPTHMYIAVSTYVGAAYLWIISIVYVPQTVMFGYAFLLTGMAVAAAHIAGVIKTKKISAKEGYTTGIALTGATVAVAVVAFGLTALHVERIASGAMLTRAVVAVNAQDLPRAERIARHASVFVNDVRVGQLATNIGMAQLSQIINDSSEEDVQTQRAQFQEELTQTIAAARATVAADETNYRSWILLGDVYASLIPFGIEGAYESAANSYAQALTYGPKNPLPLVYLARLAFAQEEYETARAFANQALSLKSNFTDAHFILSQIAIREGNVTEAIAATESAALLRPGNAGILFQLGLLYYSEGSYEKVVPVLEQAVTINPNYANALYFLGLAYEKTEDAPRALAAFKQVAALNPDNELIISIVDALESGGSAFDVLGENVQPVIGSDELPISEDQ